jgi:hypothetical protein
MAAGLPNGATAIAPAAIAISTKDIQSDIVDEFFWYAVR